MTMSLSGKVQVAQEIKSPKDVFAETFYGSNKKILPKLCPDKIPVLELLEGNWREVGCAICAHYLKGGERTISKERITAVDEKNMSITYEFEGDLMKLYKIFKITLYVDSQGQKNFLNINLEYEKQNEDVPSPEPMTAFMTEIAKVVDAYVLNNIHSSPLLKLRKARP